MSFKQEAIEKFRREKLPYYQNIIEEDKLQRVDKLKRKIRFYKKKK